MTGAPWLILPTYNEAENIEAIVTVAGDVLATSNDGIYKILIVDDGSPDGTGEIHEYRLYQLIRQKDQIRDRTFEIEFLDPGVQAFSFTFG